MASDSNLTWRGHLLSDIVTYRSKILQISNVEDGLDGVAKNPYHSVWRKVHKKDDVSSIKLLCLFVPTKCRLVSSKKCCKEQCCQTIWWEDTVHNHRRFYATTFEARREMSFAEQDQLHTVPGKRNFFLTLANVDDCEVAW